MQLDHVINWSNSRLLNVEINYFRRLDASAWFISSYVIGRSDGGGLLHIYSIFVIV